MESKVMQPWRELFSHHRKFTPFQRVLMASVLMGVTLCVLRSWWCLGLIATYTVTLYSSVSATKYVLICKTLLPSDVVLSLYDTLSAYISQLFDLGVSWWHPQKYEKGPKTCHNSKDSRVYHESTKEMLQNNCSAQEEMEFQDSNGLSIPLHKHNFNYNSSSRPDHCKLREETQAIIHLIKRDFFESWYNLFSKEKITLDEAESLFSHVSQELEGRVRHADTYKLLEYILLLLKDHLHYVHQAKIMFKVQSKKSRRKSQADTGAWSFAKPAVFTTVEDCYGSKVGLHPAVKSSEIEQVYQKSIVELLLVHLLWDNMLASRTLVCALKEILMCNILQNVVNLLCDATFLHEKIIKITSDEELCVSVESIPVITISETPSQEQTVQSILTKHSHSNVEISAEKVKDNSDSENKELDNDTNTLEKRVNAVTWKDDLEVFPVSKQLCHECNRLSSDDAARISPRPHSCSLGKNAIFFIPGDESDQLSINSVSSSASVEFKNCEEIFDDEIETNDSEIGKIDKLPHAITSVDENQRIIDNFCKTEDMSPSERTSSTSSETEEKSSSNIFPSLKRFSIPNPLNFIDRKRLSPSAEEAAPPHVEKDVKRSQSQTDVMNSRPGGLSQSDESPSVFQDVRITDTETAKENYTLYVIEFEALYQSDESGLVHRSGVVKRRYSEFINLQSWLDDNPSYKKSMKDIKGPKKILPSLPFGNMGRDTVDNRKQLLETFLKALIAKPDLCNSKEMIQFMGYSGDGHIAFVKKNPESTGSRIDQRVVKTMSDVFDKIVEGLPSLPQQLPRIIPQFEQSDEKDAKVEEELSSDTDYIDLIYDFDEEKSSKELASILEKFVELQEISGDIEDNVSLNDTTLGTSILTWQDQQLQQQQQQGTSEKQRRDITPSENKAPSIAVQNVRTSESSLNDAAIDLLTELLQRQDHWICRENVIKAAKVLFGKGINRLIEEKVEFFTSSDMVLFYLKTFHDTIWPQDELSTEQRPVYTDLQREQIQNQATRCLIEFLPGILKFVVGSEESDIAVNEVIECFKYEKLNRHFWYTVLDVILEELFPEVNTLELQRKLSGSLNSL